MPTAVEVTQFMQWLTAEDGADMHSARPWPSLGIWTGIHRKMFHWSIMTGNIGDLQSVENQWCYQTLAGATRALSEWNPERDKEPDGWHRHPASGRRRPDGHKAREYISA